MKKYITTQIIILLILLLFVYTSASKFLDYDKFVFQMRLAPVPLMKTFAPIIGWFVPSIELVIAIFLTVGFFCPNIQKNGLYAAVVLLSAFEIYIVIMLLSGSKLPCTCGGVISKMGWKEHLLFNGFFISTGILSIRYLRKNDIDGLMKSTYN